MGLLDYIILAAVGVGLVTAVLFSIRRRKNGKGCCGDCSACSYCKKRKM